MITGAEPVMANVGTMRVMTNSDMRRYDGVIRLVIATAISIVGCSKGAASDAPQAVRPSIRQLETKPSLSLEAVVVPVTNILTTRIGFWHTTPSPWKDGNHLTFYFRKPPVPGQEEERAVWSVVNMHTENFSEITRQLKIDAVEVLVLHTKRTPITIQEIGGPKHEAFDDEGYALITDPRIPREWLLPEPRWGDRKIESQLKAGYPKNFRAAD